MSNSAVALQGDIGPSEEALGEDHTPRVRRLRALVQDLAPHRPGIYWTDLLSCMTVFWAAFVIANLRWTDADVGVAVSTLVAVLALYRASIFLHELVHMPRGAVPGFKWAWNVLCGVPLLLPSYFYLCHIDHHAVRTYGTRGDPEYLPLLRRSFPELGKLVLGTVLSPVLMWIRFALLAPLAWLCPALRRLVDERASSVTLHPHYRADASRLGRLGGEVRLLETMCVVYVWALTGLVATGQLALHWVGTYIFVVLAVLLTNMARTVFAHRYRHAGEELSHAQQIADSTTLNRGGLLVELVAPLALRYHALHHLFPYLPYHALPEAHRRMVGVTQPPELYLQTFHWPRPHGDSQPLARASVTSRGRIEKESA